MADVDLSDIDRRMDGALSALQKEFNGLRTGTGIAKFARTGSR